MEAVKFNLQNTNFQRNNYKINPVSNQRISSLNNINDYCSFSGKSETIMSYRKIAEALSEHIAKNSKPADEFVKEVAAKSDVLMLGEKHNHIGAKNFAISMLGTLKEMGYTDVAVEVSSRLQKYVDSFLAGKLSEDDLIEKTFLLYVNNHYCNPVIEGCSVEMLKECRKLGLNVHCIDSRDEHFFNKILSSDKLYDSLKFGLDGYFLSKERRIFHNLNKGVFKNNPDAKVLVYIGEAHILKSPTKEIPKKRLRQFIDKTGKKVNSLRIVEPEKGNDFIDTSKIKSNIGFSTTDKLISDLAYHSGDNPYTMKPQEHYGKHLDGIVIIDKFYE